MNVSGDSQHLGGDSFGQQPFEDQNGLEDTGEAHTTERPPRPWDNKKKSILDKPAAKVKAFNKRYGHHYNTETSRKVLSVVAKVGAGVIFGSAIPVQRTYAVFRIGASGINAKVKGKDAQAAMAETANKMNGWYRDLKAVPGHVDRFGESFAPNKTFTKRNLPEGISEKQLLERTVEIDLQGFSDQSAAFEKYKQDRIAKSGGKIQEGDFYQFKRTMLTHDSIEQYAMDLAEKLTELAIARGHNPDGGEPRMKVVLNTHSMGGLEAIQLAYLIEKYDLPIEITHVVFNGTPLEGSDAAKLGVLLGGSKCARQMVPGSNFLTKGGLVDKKSFTERAKNSGSKLRKGQFKEAKRALRQDKDGEREGSIAEKAKCLRNAKILITGSNHDTMVPPDSAKGMDTLKYLDPENIERATFQVGEGHVSFVDSDENRETVAEWMDRTQAFQPGRVDDTVSDSRGATPAQRKKAVQRLLPPHIALKPGKSFEQKINAYVKEIREQPVDGQSMGDVFNKMEFLARLDDLSQAYVEEDDRLANIQGHVTGLEGHLGVDAVTAKAISQVGKKEFKALQKHAAGQKSGYSQVGGVESRLGLTKTGEGGFFVHLNGVHLGGKNKQTIQSVIRFDDSGKYDKSVDPEPRFMVRTNAFEKQVSGAIKNEAIRLLQGSKTKINADGKAQAYSTRAIEEMEEAIQSSEEGERPEDSKLDQRLEANLSAMSELTSSKRLSEAAASCVGQINEMALAHIDECLVDAIDLLKLSLPPGEVLSRGKKLNLIRDQANEQNNSAAHVVIAEIERVQEEHGVDLAASGGGARQEGEVRGRLMAEITAVEGSITGYLAREVKNPQ